MLRTVIQVKPTDAYKVYVYFDDGKIKLYDMTHLIGKGVFQAISDRDVFIEKCVVINQTLAWDIGGNFDATLCLDVDPETIYKNGLDVEDPLRDHAA